MKKAGLQIKKDDDKLILIVIFIVVIAFIFGLKPIYKTIGKLKNGTLFKADQQTQEPVKEPAPEEVYKILKPVGASKVLCKKTISDESGDETIKATIYYSTKQVKSIKEDISYSGISDEYSNYILSEQSKYKQRKNKNLKNKGYSIEFELDGTSNLKVSSVYLLDKTNLTDLVISEKDELEVYGVYNDDVYDLTETYSNSGYICEW